MQTKERLLELIAATYAVPPRYCPACGSEVRKAGCSALWATATEEGVLALNVCECGAEFETLSPKLRGGLVRQLSDILKAESTR